MHQASEQPEFIKTIKEIREAEEAYDRLIMSAKEKADKMVREAKEKIQEERTKGDEEIVAFKNERLRKGSKDIESEVEQILSEARERTAEISKKKVDSQSISKLVKDFLSSL